MAKQEGAFTMVPNWMLEDASLNTYEFRILMWIVRQTIGYGKKSDGISVSQFVRATGISKATVIRTINTLKDKKYIKVTKQMLERGGKSFNRYSINLVSERDKLVSEGDNPSITQTPPLVSEGDIQNKIEQNKIDKRTERQSNIEGNIYFSLTGKELRREVNRFCDEMSDYQRHPASYKMKLKKQLEKGHTQTLENFEEWYLKEKCSELSNEYVGKKWEGGTIVSIHSYLTTKGFNDKNKFIVQLDDGYIKIFENFEDAENELGYATD